VARPQVQWITAIYPELGTHCLHLRARHEIICNMLECKSRRVLLTILTIITKLAILTAQPQVAIIANGSLEGTRELFRSWNFPGDSRRNHPEICFTKGNLHGVRQLPFDGVCYLAMVVRDDGTFESITQKLPVPVWKGNYRASMRLSRSDGMKSYTLKGGDKLLTFNDPAVVRFYVGKSRKNRTLILETKPIDHENWQEYFLDFALPGKMSKIWIEARHLFDDGPYYNGNILVDKVSITRL
jgi:hypothetical protein